MTINTTANRVVQIGNGVTTVWNYSFLIPDATEVVVQIADTVTGIVTTLLTSQYAITGIGNAAGGTVTYPNPGTALTATQTITISRILPVTQSTSLSNQGAFYPAVVETEFDYLTMVCQQLNDAIGRALLASANGLGTVDAGTSRIINVVNGVNAQDAVTLSQMQAQAAAGGNVPLPTVGQVGQYLKATATNVFAWAVAQVTSANITDSTAAGRNMLTAASVAAQQALLSLGSLALLSSVAVPANLTTTGTAQAATRLSGTGAWSGVSPAVRQTVLNGPVDTLGAPSFLPATSANLNLTSQNITSSAPFVVSAANGADASGTIDLTGVSTANLTWTGLTASQTNYLYVDISAAGVLTTGFTILPPTYQWGGTRSITSGQFTFNVQEMSATVGNGATAPQTYRVFVGEAVCAVGTVTSTVAYAYQGRALISIAVASFAASTRTAFTHNLGCFLPSDQIPAQVINVTAEGGFTTGQTTGVFSTLAGPFPGSPSWISLEDRNTSSIVSGAGGVLQSYNRTTGANFVPTAANWKWHHVFLRGW